MLTKTQYNTINKKLAQIMAILKRAEVEFEKPKKKVEVGFRLGSGDRIFVTAPSVEVAKQRIADADLTWTNILSVEECD